jgi:hypothetical protein
MWPDSGATLLEWLLTRRLWTITARTPQSTHDRGYAATREAAMAEFKAAWERK